MTKRYPKLRLDNHRQFMSCELRILGSILVGCESGGREGDEKGGGETLSLTILGALTRMGRFF